MYQEAIEIADTVLHLWRYFIVRSLCANRSLAGDWEAAHRYALEAVELRNAAPARLMWLDFVRHHETEALLRGGNEELAREDVKSLGEREGTAGFAKFVWRSASTYSSLNSTAPLSSGNSRTC